MKLFASGLAVFAATLTLSSAVDAQTFTGPGGAIPDFVSGTWDHANPAIHSGPYFSSTLFVTVPVHTVDNITITGWDHSWIGDLQVMLVDPLGIGHNVMVRPFKSPTSTYGNAGDILLPGPHRFEISGTPVPDATSVSMPSGVYMEHFGDPTAPWSSSPGNLLNGMTVENGLSGITPSPLFCGTTWELRIYDWAMGDTGNLAGWSMDLNGPLTAPVVYCTGKINSLGCTPSMGFTGNPSATCNSGFQLWAINEINNKPGLLIYSEFGRESKVFGLGGILCIKAPVRKAKGLNSGGNLPPAADCSGVYSIDFNMFTQGGLGLPPTPAAFLKIPGQRVTAQFWGRDTGIAIPNNFSLSNAVEFFVGP